MNKWDADALDKLAEGAAKLEVGLSSEQVQLFSSYLDLLYRWHKLFNLTAVTPDKWIAKHLLDSLSAHQFIPQNIYQASSDKSISPNCIDIGSGAGLPGIPLAIVMPSTNWFLLEKNTKKCGFLLRVKLELGLNNLHVINASVDKLQGVLQDIKDIKDMKADASANTISANTDETNTSETNTGETNTDEANTDEINTREANTDEINITKQIAFGSQLPTEFGLAIGRSVFGNDGLLDHCYALVANGGVAIDMHGQYSGQPKNTSKWQVEKFSKVRVPYLQASRHIICWQKTG